MNSKISRLLSLFLTGLLVLGANTVLWAQQGREWKVRYEAGEASLKRDTELRLTIEQTSLVCRPKKGAVFSIPLAAVTEVGYDKQARRRIKQGAAVMVFSLGAGAIVMMTKSTKHYVNITTKVEGGAPREYIFRLDKDDYKNFLAEMQRATGQPWHDRDAEYKRTLNDLEQAKQRALPVTLPRAARVSDVELSPGQYQVILLERGNQTGELYFFAGKKVEPKKARAVGKVSIINEPNSVAAAQAQYQENGALSEIRLATQTWRFVR